MMDGKYLLDDLLNTVAVATYVFSVIKVFALIVT